MERRVEQEDQLGVNDNQRDPRLTWPEPDPDLTGKTVSVGGC